MGEYQIGEHLSKFNELVSLGHARFVNDGEHPELSERLLNLIGVTAQQWEKFRIDQREREKLVVQTGDLAPDFELSYLADPHQTFRLSSRRGRPVGLVFAAYTRPPFRLHAARLEALYRRLKDRVTFVYVYIREAHPGDKWQSEANLEENILFKQPQNLEQRREVANVCRLDLKLSIPMIVDDMENSAERKYSARPERLFVVNSQGHISYKGGPGPFGFRIGPFEEALERCLAREKEPHKNWG